MTTERLSSDPVALSPKGIATQGVGDRRSKLLAGSQHRRVDANRRVIDGAKMAQEGPFKSGRGMFDLGSLMAIARIVNAYPGGLPCFWTHGGSYNGHERDTKTGRLSPICFVRPTIDQSAERAIRRLRIRSGTPRTLSAL